MRTKLFIAFFLVILLALFSNFIFEHLITRDFRDYVRGTREDNLYWLLASVESSYSPQSGWDKSGLENAMHWALMLRFECMVTDKSGQVLADTRDISAHLTETMKRRMEMIEAPVNDRTPYDAYPLFSNGQEIGLFIARDIKHADSVIKRKENIFLMRGKRFLLVSFVIAGGGAVFLALVFSQFLSKPILELKTASEAVAKGDLSVRLSTGRDEIGRLKGAFNHMAEALQREDGLRRQLTSNVAHELRTPLAVMKVRLEAMQDGIIETDKTALAGLKSELDTLTRLIAGIEDLTKAEASFFKKNAPEKVNLREFLEGITDGIKPLFTEKGLWLKIDSDKSNLSVYTEPEKLEKVLRNILSNALAHTEEGGVTLSYGKENGRFYINAADTGKGISQEELPMIFNRFYKGRNSKGFGLGLAIAKELIEIMGGTIEARSIPGAGAAFIITLPAARA